MSGKRCPCRLTRPCHNVHHTCREACLDEKLSEPQGCEWSQRRWLEDDSASCCQCWAQFPGGHKQGEIPGNDLTNDADGLSQRIGEVIAWHGDGNSVPFNLGGPARHVAEQIHGQGDISRTGFRDGFAIIKGFKLGKLLAMLLKQFSNPPDMASPFGRGHSAPGATIKGSACCPNSAINIFFVALSHLGNDLTSRWIVDWEDVAR